MTEDELRLAFDQQNEMLVRFVTLIERLTDRVEVLELEALHQRSPALPAASEAGDTSPPAGLL